MLHCQDYYQEYLVGFQGQVNAPLKGAAFHRYLKLIDLSLWLCEAGRVFGKKKKTLCTSLPLSSREVMSIVQELEVAKGAFRLSQG